MEDGTLAALFVLWALSGLDRDNPFARQPMDPGASLGFGRTIVDRKGRGHELRFEYRRDHAFSGLQPVIEVSATSNGGFYLGSGFRKERDLGDHWYFAGSNVTGLWLGRDVDLGGMLEFRTTVEMGRAFGDRTLALAWDHRSNAGLGRINPGMEVLSVRYGWEW